MRNLLLAVFGFWLSCTYSQERTVYKYYLYLADYHSAHSLVKTNGKMEYTGVNSNDRNFFKNYEILEYNQAFTDGIDAAVLNIYYLETYSSQLATDLKSTYSSIYLGSDDLTGWKVELLDSYPNDYGTTSPVANLGAPASRKDLDYIHAPKAWDITKGNSAIKIGISDTEMNINTPDLINKVTLVAGMTTTTVGQHGTSVAAFAAARGNNGTGTVGVCMDCNIVSANNWSIIGNGPNGIPATVYSNLYKMAKLGAKVINMSWTNSGYVSNSNGFIAAEQAVINDLVNNYNVTIVASAGNSPSFSTPESFISKLDTNGNPTGVPKTPFGVIYVYPATYDNVISVSSINHKYAWTLPIDNSTADPSYCCPTPWFTAVHVELEDCVTGEANTSDPMNPIAISTHGYNLGLYNPNGFQPNNHTLNPKVDILAPGYNLFTYSGYAYNGTVAYYSGTSFAGPLVAGTIGLMLSVNDCLKPGEIETILKLTTKDIENMPINMNFVGYVGAGKLETGDAVEFVNEMKKADGNAVIDNHIFNRFNYKLEKFNNKLTINNVTFKDGVIADFKARKEINILPGTELLPNNQGSINLNIDGNIDLTCVPVVFPRSAPSGIEQEVSNVINSNIVLSPNPNKGIFTILLKDKDLKNASVTVFDILGKSIYSTVVNGMLFEINLPDIPSGMYFVKVEARNYSETLKFIKN